MSDVNKKALERVESSIQATISTMALGRGLSMQAGDLVQLVEAKRYLLSLEKPKAKK